MDDQEVPTSRGFLPSRCSFLPNPRNQLPDLDFPLNTMAEGRVLVPWEHQKYPNLTVQYTAGSFSVETSSFSNTL